MNARAEKLLSEAKSDLAKGEGFYRKAAEKITAAKGAGATWTEIADFLGRSRTWCSEIVQWAEIPANSVRRTVTPYSGEEYADRKASDHARRVLREAPLEQVEQIIADLPVERQQAVAAAAGNRYAKARQEYDENERNMTPAQRKEREAAVGEVRQDTGKMMSGFNAFGIASYLASATGVLKEMVSTDSVTNDALRQIEVALAEFLDEYRVAQAMVEEEVQA